MDTLMLHLPEHLHHKMQSRAQSEGVSLENWILSAALQKLVPEYRVEAVTEDEIRQQESHQAARRQGLRRISKEEARRILLEPEVVPPEDSVDPEAVELSPAHLVRSAQKSE